MKPHPPPAPAPPDEIGLRLMASRILDLRHLRCKIFPVEFLGETAWEMLLLLYSSRVGTGLSVGKLAELTNTAETSASRWIDYLEAHGLITRDSTSSEGRVALIALTNEAKTKLYSYLTQVLMTSL